MKQNKTLLSVGVFAVSMVLLSGCAKDEKSLWLKQQVAKRTFEKEQFKTRSPAQSAPRCYNDRFQDSMIQTELQKMEAAYAEGKKGDYKHGDMEFTGLPQATIDALKANYLLQTEVTGTTSWTAVDPKQKDCKDFSCFVNALYATPTNEGLLHYWYFLKTGYPISAVKAYSWFNNQRTTTEVVDGYPLEKYLFDKDEWKAFWLATNLLPASMLHMPSINAIHRLPHGFIPPSWKTNGTCGWAVGYWNGGEILLSDECLTLFKSDLFDKRAYFYQSTTHELAHRLSAWNFATKTGPSKKMDEEPEFLALSGWWIDRLVQPDGSYKLQWKNNNESTGWPSSYGRTSPAEDFAETVGTYRTNPSYLYGRAPAKYAYVKKKVFGGRGYNNDDLKERYSEDIKNGVIEHVEDWIAPCLAGKDGTPVPQKQQALAKVIEVKVPVDAKIKSCIQKQVIATIASELVRIRYDEPEGCNILNSFEVAISSTAVTKLVPDLNEYFKTYEKLTDLIGGVKLFRDALATSYDGRALVLACASEQDSAACYETKAGAEFDRLYQLKKVLLSPSVGDITDIERKRFLAINSYEKVYGETVQFYESFFVKFNDEIKSRTDTLWQTCLAVPSRVNTNVLLEPYSAGSQYVSPAIIQCLNEKLPEEMTAIRSAAGDAQGVNIASPEARAWVNQRILLPRFKAILDAKVIEASSAEVATLSGSKQAAIDSTYQSMTEDPSWKKSDIYSYADCKAAANPMLQQTLKTDSYRFTTMDPVVDDLGNQVCEKIRAWFTANANTRNRPSTVTNTPVVPQTPPIPTEGQKKELDAVWKTLLPLVVTEAETRFDHCRSRAYFAQRLKRFCLFTEWVVDDEDHYRKNAWNWTKERAIRKWMANADVKALMATKTYTADQWSDIAKARAEDERQDFVDAILDRFYGGTVATDKSE